MLCKLPFPKHVCLHAMIVKLAERDKHDLTKQSNQYSTWSTEQASEVEHSQTFTQMLKYCIHNIPNTLIK